MNQKSRFVFAGYVVAGLILMAASVEAGTYYWDVNGKAAGPGGTSPNGIWDGNNPAATNWNTDSNGGAGTLTNLTTASDTLYFSAGTEATGLFTVTLVNTQNCGAVSVQEGSVNFAGGVIKGSGAFNVGTIAGTPASLIINTGGVLTNSAGLTVGDSYSGNSMVLTNGGQAFMNGVIGVGYTAATANSNSLVITGTNSLFYLTGNTLRLGYNGASNNVVRVDNSGVLIANNSNTGVELRGSGNSFTVTNSGAVNAYTFNLGVVSGNRSNSLTIVDGGSLVSAAVTVGGSAGANRNQLVVSAGCLTNNGSLVVGNSGSDNSMLVANGGQVLITQVLGVGYGAASATSNRVVITGTNSLLTTTGNSVRLGASGGSNNFLTVDNSGVLISTNGGNCGVFVGGGNAGTTYAFGNSLFVTNNGKVYSYTLQLGQTGGASNNTATIANGGLLVNTSGGIYVGQATGANGNTLVVSAGVITNNTTLSIGSNGSGNSMLVTNGSQVFVNSTLIVGDSAANANNNSLVITGTNSLVKVTGNTVRLGWNASMNNLLKVDAGGVLIATNSSGVSIGGNNNASRNAYNNSVVVTNEGSLLANYIKVGVGAGATSNSMVIADGGLVFCGAVSYIGSDSYTNDFGNFVTISSSTTNKSVWSMGNAQLTVGNTATCVGNHLNVLGGGMVTNISTLAIGTTLGGSANFVDLSGGGLLEVNTGITVGLGSNNSLTNQGGILQFTKAAPTITTNAGGNVIVMNGGTLGYRGIQSGTLPNLTDNLGTTGVGRFIWQGNNTFRLDNCFATNTVAGGYTFGTGQPNGSKNYTSLELVNGTTKLLGTVPVTIASTGSLLVFNTTASISGAFTNNGSLTITNSTLALLNGGTFGQSSTVNWMSTNSQVNVTGTLNLPAVMTVNVGLGSSYRPNGEVLFTATGFSGPGAASLNGWVITGTRSGTYAVISNGQVQLKTPAGSLIRFY